MKDIKDVFISYGRRESLAFSNKLYHQLVEAGYSAWYDHVNIPKGDDFQKRIDNGIEMAHNFVFVIAPHAVKSEFCRKEIELAVRLKKRIIPILQIEDMDKDVWAQLHPIIGETNWIYGREKMDMSIPLDEWPAIDDFDTAVKEVIELLEADKPYVQQHTELLYKAQQWERSHKLDRFLLQDRDLHLAQEWLQTEFIPPHQPPCLPTLLHAEYITESQKAANNGHTDVFMAYARPDAAMMNRFNDYLTRQGITTWIDTRDIKSDVKFELAIEQGIQQTDNVLFFISPASMASPVLKRELELSLQYGKRVIPLLIEPTDFQEMTEQARQLSYTDMTAVEEAQFPSMLDQIYSMIQKDQDYHRQHKRYLVQALQWDRHQRVMDDLLSGEDLQAAEEWLLTGASKAKESRPTRLHTDFIRESKKLIYKNQISGLDVTKDAFISYNRGQSLEFVWDLFMRLTDEEFVVWFDQNDIPLGVDFQSQIDQGILKADNFIFVMSPGSIRSIYCLKEILLAVQMGKRIIPILHIMPGKDDWQQMAANVEKLKAENPASYDHSASDTAVQTMQKLNWAYFREDDDFESSLDGLANLLRSHADYVRRHTTLLNKGLDWEKHQKSVKYLLVGEERMKAEEWLTHDFERSQPPCYPADIHAEFICESKKNANNLMTEAFICYAVEDRPLRDQVRMSLAKQGVTTWIHDKDINKGTDYSKAIEEGIEQADNVLFFISPGSVVSEYCLREIDYALQLNKRIIPLLIRPTPEKDLPKSLQKLQYIDLTDINTPNKYHQAIDNLLSNLQMDQDYHHQHKAFLVQALKWDRNERNKSFQLRGYNLKQAGAWLRVGRKHAMSPPLELHEEFIAASQLTGTSLTTDVFVSYSRANSGFARKLNDHLQVYGKTTWFDQESIASGSDFATEINNGIENGDNFLFILSPRAIQSEYCAAEVEHAAKFGKRFVTVLYEDIDVEELHPELAKVQWIDFRPQHTDFNTAFADLIHTLETDLEHVRMHTRMQMRQTQWANKAQDASLLLSGNTLKEAETWLADSGGKEPEPTDMQRNFILASRKEVRRKRFMRLTAIAFIAIVTVLAGIAVFQYGKAEIARREAEEQRVLAEQNAEEAHHQRQIAEKQRQIAEQNAQEADHQRLLAEQNAKEANDQRRIAEEQRQLAEQLKVQAENNRNEAINNEVSLRLASVYRLRSQDDGLNALLEGVHAGFQVQKADVPDYQILDTIEALKTTLNDVAEVNRLSTGEEGVYDVTVSPDAQTVLATTLDGDIHVWDQTGQPQADIHGHDGVVIGLEFSPDGERIASVGKDRTLRFWDRDGTLLKTIDAHDGTIWDVHYSPDGSQLVTAAADNTIKLWDRDGNLQTTLEGHLRSVTRMSFYPKNTGAVASASWDGTVRLWDTSQQSETILIDDREETFTAAIFSPDGNWLAVVNTNKQIEVWDVSTLQQPHRSQVLTGHDEYITDVVWSTDSRFLASSSRDKTVKVWQPDGTVVTTLLGHEGPVNSVVFTPAGYGLVSASHDGTVRQWRLDHILDPPPETDDLDRLLSMGCEWLQSYLETGGEEAADGVCAEKFVRR